MELPSPSRSDAHPLPRCYDSALCLLPPGHLFNSINDLRLYNDQAVEEWPPHVNLIYPFVRPDALPEVAARICQLDPLLHDEVSVRLNRVGTFNHKEHCTVYVGPCPDEETIFRGIRSQIFENILGWDSGHSYRLHMTVAQSKDCLSDRHTLLLEKARLLLPIAWQTQQVAILVRETNATKGNGSPPRMRVWGYIDLVSRTVLPNPEPTIFDLQGLRIHANESTDIDRRPTFVYSRSESAWHSLSDMEEDTQPTGKPGTLTIYSYNIPSGINRSPDSSDYLALLATILSNGAEADVLVLLEVTDEALAVLQTNEEICCLFPFATHGPPGQAGVGPLPSLANIVVLSKYPLQWELLSSNREGNGFVIVSLPTVLTPASHQSDALPLVLAACHLHPGLSDADLMTKSQDVFHIVEFLAHRFPLHPQILVGDFNIPASSSLIEAMLTGGKICHQGRQTLIDIHEAMANAGLRDAWLATAITQGASWNTAVWHGSDFNVCHGESGATFHPTSTHHTAAELKDEPERHFMRCNRIFASDHILLQPLKFKVFGHDITGPAKHDEGFHSGIWCRFGLLPGKDDALRSSQQDPVNLCRAPPRLGDTQEIYDLLTASNILPKAAEESDRKTAVDLLKRVLCEEQGGAESGRQLGVDLILIPVGSYGLGVWTTSSDVNCLCLGSMTSKTFFALAWQRLRSAEAEGISILRRAKSSSETMFGLQIRGIRFGLSYCAATLLSQQFPSSISLPPSHPAFALPSSTLSKLRPIRDLQYLQRSIPDVLTYRAAHLLIKSWALARGLYARRFGLFGGIHISILLVPVYKDLASTTRILSAADVVTSLFRHYAGFDWATQVVFDPYFHNTIRYPRTPYETLCLLGWHPPTRNTALSLSRAVVKSLETEVLRANALISQKDVPWSKTLNLNTHNTSGITSEGVNDFLQEHGSFLKVEARSWGSSPSKIKQVFGWLESRCVSAVTDLDRKLPHLAPRIWPARFSEVSSENAQDRFQEVYGCYLIGLNLDFNRQAEFPNLGWNSLDEFVHDFELRIHRDGRHYDARSCWMAASVVNEHGADHLRLDWVPASSDGDYFTDSEEEVDDDAFLAELAGDEAVSPEASRTGKDQSPGSKSGGPESASRAGKFRTALDIMNRLRWDAEMEPSNYVVGYEDRFRGAREKPLEDWKTDLTDEEFIPQHRILYFRRISDKVIVWERKTRIDRIFGSG